MQCVAVAAVVAMAALVAVPAMVALAAVAAMVAVVALTAVEGEERGSEAMPVPGTGYTLNRKCMMSPSCTT